MGLDVHRFSEFKLRLHPNQKLRAWYLSHTFGGTTKSRSLKILGFSKKTFYWVLAGVLALAAAGARVAIYIIRGGLQSAQKAGENRGLLGQFQVTQTTQTRARTFVSSGLTFSTTEIATFQTTFQRGAKSTQVVQTGADGSKKTFPATVVISTNSFGQKVSVTKVGNTLIRTSDDVVEETTVFGVPVTFTSDGSVIATTSFEGITVITGEDGQPQTSFLSSTTLSTTAETSTSGDAGPTPTLTTPTNTPTTSRTSATITKPTTSSGSGTTPGGDGEEFEGEATFYAPGLGSCGTEATDADFVAALSKELFDATGVANSNNNPYCGRKAFVQAGSDLLLFRREVNLSDNGTTWGYLGGGKSQTGKASRRKLLRVHNASANSPGPPPSGVGPHKSLITPAPDPKKFQKRSIGGGGVTVTIVDRCPVCKKYDLDLSPAAYNAIGDPDAGRVLIKWRWLD